MRTRLSWITLLLVSLWTSTGAIAQDSHSQDAHYWLGLGLGKTKFPSGMVSLGYEPAHKNTLVAARYTLSAEILQPIEPGIRVNELGLLYGVKLGKFRLSTGISRVWGNNRGAYLSTDLDPLFGTGHRYAFLGYSTIGIPGEIRFLTSDKHVGFGITAYGNYNQKQSFAGLNVVMYLGKIKVTGMFNDD